ncbi:CUB domain-containing protein 1 isoform X1 [Tympanuchus pallidicinctus]|uniref:CUB domain-containing protein 1 isoform X1 n=1 Tax=Tympanuchus pallidicinctus TaxID=109042 RepID=UPI00228727B1|nr:CUB domain-containing protein 1 isoform X1 [Tympanuchus pallidicinctus]
MAGVRALLVVLAVLIAASAQHLQREASFTVSLRAVDNITVTIKMKPGVLPVCLIRVKNGPRFELKIRPGENVTLTFSCNTPEKYFMMEIQKNIDCVSGPCPFGDVHLYPPGLPRLNRTFIWDVKASTKAGLELKFSAPLRQIQPGEVCPDLVSYSINSCIDAATVNIGTFCRNGSVSRVKLLGGVILSLHLPWNLTLTTSGFNIANRSSIKRLCIIESTLEGESSIMLMSPNYPLGFPEDELMTWQFVVPSNMRASVFFHDYSLSNCERKEERVEYYIPGSVSNPEVFKLSDSQPANIAGSFNLSLQGCDQDAQNPGILRLLFQVVVQHPQIDENVTHVVDLSKERNMTVTIHFEGWPRRTPLVSEPMCLICKDPRTCDRVLTLASGATYKISFLCKDLSSLRITAEKGISCVGSLRWCGSRIYSLSVPKTITQLPVQLHKFIWRVIAPELINIEITSPSLKLRQHLPEQSCNTSYSYNIFSATPETEMNVGIFCPGGAIEKIQLRNNITISLKTFGKGFVNESNHQDLKMSFVPHIKDECTFTVSPNSKAKTYLQTPNSLYGLPPYVSISWYVIVPSQQVARLGFSTDRMGIACETGRAYLNIKEQMPGAEETVRREDELLPQPRNMHHNFWVNVSNCKPVDPMQLTLKFWVTFVEKQIDLAVILGVLAAAGVLAAIGLTVCCVKKKKKKNQNPMVGVYNANVSTQMPGKQRLFQKDRKTNESHVYAVIDDAMVYGHLLKESNGSVTPEVDVYQPFDGPMGSLPPSPPPFSFRKDSIKHSPNTEEPPLLAETDRDTYTFAHQKSGDLEDSGDENENNNGDTSMSLLENKEQNSLEE